MHSSELVFPQDAFGATSGLSRQFVAWLLQLDPSRRPSAAEALRGPWFSACFGARDAEMVPSACVQRRRADRLRVPELPQGVRGGGASASDSSSSSSRAITPLAATPLATPKRLRGLTAEQFACGWQMAARMSAAWLLDRRSAKPAAQPQGAPPAAASGKAACANEPPSGWQGRGPCVLADPVGTGSTSPASQFRRRGGSSLLSYGRLAGVSIKRTRSSGHGTAARALDGPQRLTSAASGTSSMCSGSSSSTHDSPSSPSPSPDQARGE